MKSAGRVVLVALAVALASLAWHVARAATPQAGQPTGSIEFIARVTPTDGRPEPVRQLAFYLLRKSLTAIQKEVEESEAKPDLDKFVDALEVSPELRAWMKKNRTVELAGTDFIRRLKVNDVLDVPEFYEAYLRRNSGDVAVGFPAPKYRESDKATAPQKYEKLHAEYREAVRKWIVNSPQSVDGIEVHLDAINPGQRWAQLATESRRRVRKRTLDLAQTRYLVAKTDSDLDGRGAFTALPPGDYWLGTLETEAVVGDARLRWDVPVSLQAGQRTRVELSNLNALEPQHPSR